MLLKWILIALLLLSLINLFRALPVLLKKKHNASMSRHLGKRVFFSALILFLLFIALITGQIEPNIPPF